jgi:glycosyltransferase involved in cell wall biosynthesis
VRRTAKRVLVLNDYALAAGLDRHRRGDYPGHLVHGLARLPGHFDIGLLREDAWAARVGRHRVLRNLATQLRAAAVARRHDVLVSLGGYETLLAAILRRAFRRRRPGLVALVHRPVPVGAAGRLMRSAYAGHDLLLCISPLAYAQLSAGTVQTQVRRIPWGVDLDFYRPTELSDDTPLRVLSVGKTKRDHNVLVRAITGLPAELTLYCDAASAPTVPIPPNVRVHVAPRGGESIPYSSLGREYERSHVVAVPLRESDDLNGISSVLEAMASGRGVLCTRTRGSAIDVEGHGFGRALPPGDADAWRAALIEVVGDRALLAEWGARAVKIAESDYDLDRFVARLAAGIEAAAR